MKIEKNTVVTLHYEMFDDQGTKLDETDQASPLQYLHGGYDGIFPLVEEMLQEKTVGDTLDVMLSPDDAFGERDPSLVRIEDLDAFPEDADLEEGMVFEADDPDTAGDVLLFTVTKVENGKVTVDGNHPLAGANLRFVVKVLDVRAATQEEIEHGHVHGAGEC